MEKLFRAELSDRSDLYEIIMNIDKLSAVVMYLSITSSFLLAGLIILLFIMMPVMLKLLPVAVSVVYIDFFQYAFLIYILDLVGFGWLRKIKFLSYITYPFFKLFDFISLRIFFYKPFFVFGTNIKKTKVFLLVIIFFHNYNYRNLYFCIYHDALA